MRESQVLAQVKNWGTVRVLLLEDDRVFAEQMKRALTTNFSRQEMPLFNVVITADASELASFLLENSIDIYVVDLELPDPRCPDRLSKAIGLNAIKQITANSNAGIIVVTNEKAETDLYPSVELGADDFIEKGNTPETVKAKLFALWRRIRLVRPDEGELFTHAGRAFLLGDWRFEIGSRNLTKKSGEIVRLSATEHAFLRHLCVVDGNEIDREVFNISVLGRPASYADQRIDSLVDKIRTKLEIKDKYRPTFEIKNIGTGAYKLVGAREIKA